MKFLLMRAIPFVLCLSPAGPALAQTMAPPTPAMVTPKQLTAEQWREDLRFMVAEMEQRHPNLYHSISRQKFEAAVADLDARIPSLQRHEIIVGMMRLAAMIGDGHTRIEPRKDAKFGFPSLPLKLYLFDDGLFIRAAAPDHAERVGAQIVAIGGVPVEEAIRRAAEISSRDNAMGPLLFAPLFLNMPDILHALKLAPTREAAVLTLRKGTRKWTATVPAGQVEPVWPPDTDISLITPEGWIDSRSTPQPPLWLQDPLDYHRLVEMPEQGALYARLNMVANVKDQTLGEYGKKIRERARALNPRAIILDLRLNQGGNGDLRNGFVRDLIRAEDDDTKLFVLTARGTFSASQFILDDLDRLSQAVFIGEPASSKPSSFGDSYRTPLPNSGINVRTSIMWWQAGQNFAPWTYLDLSTPLRFSDYAAGRDPALDAALGYQPQPRLYDLLRQTTTPAEARKAVDSFAADPRNRYADHELQMLIGAEQLAGAKRFDEALMVAELAARHFPQSADAQLVLASAAEQAGKLDHALQAVRRALALDPDNRNGRSLLQQLTQKPGSR